MAENKRYRSALSVALRYAKNEKKVDEYMALFKKSGIETESKINLQNCMLYAGALLDENMGFDEEKTERYSNFRQEVEEDINFTQDDVKIIRKLMLDVCNEIDKKDRQNNLDNTAHYQEVYNMSKDIVKGLFEDKLEDLQRSFIDGLNIDK